MILISPSQCPYTNLLLQGIIGAPSASELLQYKGAFLLVKLSPGNKLFLMVSAAVTLLR